MRPLAGPTFDGPFDAIHNRENDMPDLIDPLPWRILTTTNLPVPGQPVLLRLKAPHKIDNPKAEPADIGTLLRPGFRYGYVVAVLRYMKDGFGNLFPLEFVAYEFSTPKGLGVEGPNGRTTLHTEMRTRYEMYAVDAWLVLS